MVAGKLLTPREDHSKPWHTWLCPCGAVLEHQYTRDYSEILGDNEWRCTAGHTWTRIQIGWTDFTWRRRADWKSAADIVEAA